MQILVKLGYNFVFFHVLEDQNALLDFLMIDFNELNEGTGLLTQCKNHFVHTNGSILFF